MQTEEKEKLENFERQDWNAEKVAEEATNKEDDEIMRQMLRGDETKGNPDERDVAGSVDSDETPHGSEEAKKKKYGEKII